MIFQGFDAVKDVVMERFLTKIIAEVFNRIELWRIRR